MPVTENTLWELHQSSSRRVLEEVSGYLAPLLREDLRDPAQVMKIADKVWDLMIEARLREFENTDVWNY